MRRLAHTAAHFSTLTEGSVKVAFINVWYFVVSKHPVLEKSKPSQNVILINQSELYGNK
jgi:hypothetical protein